MTLTAVVPEPLSHMNATRKVPAMTGRWAMGSLCARAANQAGPTYTQIDVEAPRTTLEALD
jgi:hypothetical protein